MFLPWFSMILQWFSHVFALMFPWLCNNFAMIYPCVCLDFAMNFQWFSNDFSMFFPWFCHVPSQRLSISAWVRGWSFWTQSPGAWRTFLWKRRTITIISWRCSPCFPCFPIFPPMSWSIVQNWCPKMSKTYIYIYITMFATILKMEKLHHFTWMIFYQTWG